MISFWEFLAQRPPPLLSWVVCRQSPMRLAFPVATIHCPFSWREGVWVLVCC
jgi:hypothetical protein